MVVCKQLGYPGAERHSHSSQFGYGLTKIWMDNVYCVGNEKTVSDCRYIKGDAMNLTLTFHNNMLSR